MIKGWHFAEDTLRDGSPLPAAGVELPAIDDPEPCIRGYHASVRALDALEYAPGNMVARVRLLGKIKVHGNPPDKSVARVRVGITDYIDATDLLRDFAYRCALDVAHLWDPPAVVTTYLHGYDRSDAARAAARDVAIAARDSAMDAASAAARVAASAAAWAAANSVAWADARDAAKDAVRAAVWVDRRSTQYQQRNAIWNAARDAQNKRLESALLAEIGRLAG